jgi:hypothetical protein
MAMAKYLKKSKKAAIRPNGVTRESIELLLWAMEQTDSPNPVMRQRWWEYRSKIEHPHGAVCEGVVSEQAGGVFVDRTQPQEDKSSWRNDASPLFSKAPSPFTSSHGAAVCR